MAEEPEQFFSPSLSGLAFPSLWSSSLSTLLGGASTASIQMSEGGGTQHLKKKKKKKGFLENKSIRLLKHIIL